MSLGTVSITSALLRGIAEGVDEVAEPPYTITIIIFIILIFIIIIFIIINFIIIIITGF